MSSFFICLLSTLVDFKNLLQKVIVIFTLLLHCSIEISPNTNKGFVQLLTRTELSSRASPTEQEILNDIDAMEVEESYKGPHVKLPMTLKTIEALMMCFKSRHVCTRRFQYILMHDINAHGGVSITKKTIELYYKYHFFTQAIGIFKIVQLLQ